MIDQSLGEAASFGPSGWTRFEGNPVLAEVPPLTLGVGVSEREPALSGGRGERCVVFATRVGTNGPDGVGLAFEGRPCTRSGI